MNVLIVVAHPDDEVLGCGGTIARLSEAGADVYCLVMGDGVTSRPKAGYEEITKITAQCQQAAKVLGIKQLAFSNFRDARFDTEPLLTIIKSMEYRINNNFRGTQFDYVLTHYQGDMNVDHRVVSQAVQTVFRPLPDTACKGLFYFEVLGSTEWSVQNMQFKPQAYFDITTTMEKKLEAMRIYSEELRQQPHPRSEIIIQTLARLRGSQIGLVAAEAFEVGYLRF